MRHLSKASIYRRTQRNFVAATTSLTALMMPALAMASFGNTDAKVTSFFTNINGLLNIASISVVTIAVIFAGYQIAFAHKRISDVSPILIGGFLIGAAAQIARMLIGDGDGSTAGGMAMLLQTLQMGHA